MSKAGYSYWQNSTAHDMSKVTMSGVALEMKKGKLRIILLFLSCLSLTFGTLFYIIFREQSLISLFFLPIKTYLIFPISWYCFLKNDSFVQNHLADCIWAFSLTLTLNAIVLDRNTRRMYTLGISILTSFFIEYAQYKRIVPGTFDFYDLLFQTISIFFAEIITKILLWRY